MRDEDASAALRRLPNFFVLGAAKCGTTTLHDLLASHPEVFVPVVKEPQFFSSDERWAAGVERYARTHYGAASAPARGDFTPHYLAWEKCAARIREAIPPEGQRFIVILRDPVERAYSLYWNMVAEGVEPLSFEEALAAEPQRALDPELERVGSLRFLYFGSSCYGRQLRAYLDYFSREQFLILTIDELQADAAATVRRICAFLGISSDYTPLAQSSNRAGVPRSARLHRFLRNPHWIKEPIKRLLPHDARQRLLEWLFAQNRREQRYAPMRAETERALRERFAPDVRLLGETTGLDFSRWLPR